MSEHIGGEAVEHTKNALSHKIGPLPAGVWGLAILGGIGVAVLVRRSANDQATQDAADTIDAADMTGPSGYDQADPGGTTPGVGGSTSAGGDGSYPESGGDTSTPNGPTTPTAAAKARQATTNGDWQHFSVEAMRHLGFAPGRVNAVLTAYLSGHKLDGQGTAILGAVMARCGPPPRPPKHKADPGTNGHPGAHPGTHPAPAPAHGTKAHESGTKDHGHGGAGFHGPNMPGNKGTHHAPIAWDPSPHHHHQTKGHH